MNRLHPAELIARAARDHGERPALTELSGKQVSWRALFELAERARAELQRRGVGPGDRVAIALPKSIAAVAALHGVLRAGAVCVPLDPSAPAARNAIVIADSGARVVIEDEAQLFSAAATAAPVAGEANALAYLLYTSGSTGRPKGVMLTNENVASFVDWSARTFAPHEGDRFSSHAPLCFDLSILDLFVPAHAGASVVLIDERAGKQPETLARLIREQAISIWYSVPSVLALLGEHADWQPPDGLRTILFAGEVFPLPALRRLRERTRARLFNLYGPTETNVCTFHEVQSIADDATAIPIGRPCDHVRASVTDDGELCVAGPSVTPGYWNDPDATARALFHRDGAAWYRTGDFVREAGGVYFFLGRRDGMVKKRGYRIELGEIEACLQGCPEIREAAVLACASDDGVRIDAVVCPQPGAKLSIIALKQFCAERLPLYMVPDRFSIREELPRTSRGKIDRARLGEPG
jgi:amino acid adenylation domain-containing protein